METTETIFAPAKLNLGLQVLRRLPDGYHEIHSVLVPLGFGDTMQLRLQRQTPFAVQITMPPGWEIPVEQNLIFRAALAFHQATGIPFQLSVMVEKRIPMGSGLGGGSSNAAVVLRWLNQQFGHRLSETALLHIAEQLGSDVPFFVSMQPGTIAVVGGRGEQLQWYHWAVPYEFILVLPAVAVSTERAYRALGRNGHSVSKKRDFLKLLRGYWDCKAKLQMELVNDFEAVVFQWYPALQQIKEQLLEHPLVLYAGLSGTGATVFGCALDSEVAASVAERFRQRYSVILTRQWAEQQVGI